MLKNYKRKIQDNKSKISVSYIEGFDPKKKMIYFGFINLNYKIPKFLYIMKMKILNLSMIYQILKQLQINSSTIEKF